MAELQDVVDALESLAQEQQQNRALLQQLVEAARRQAQAVGPASSPPSSTQKESETSPSRGKEVSDVDKERTKALQRRQKAQRGIAFDTASRLADPFEPAPLAAFDAAQGLLATQVGEDAAKLAFTTVKTERFIAQQTFAGTASDAANLAANNIRLDGATASALAEANQGFASLLAGNLQQAASAQTGAAIDRLRRGEAGLDIPGLDLLRRALENNTRALERQNAEEGGGGGAQRR